MAVNRIRTHHSAECRVNTGKVYRYWTCE